MYKANKVEYVNIQINYYPNLNTFQKAGCTLNVKFFLDFHCCNLILFLRGENELTHFLS